MVLESNVLVEPEVNAGVALKDDELCSIMAFIEGKRDLLAFMRACHKTYAMGIPFLAGLRAKYLDPWDSLGSLHEFMARYPTSFTGLHKLNLNWEELTRDEADLVKDLLKGGNAYLTSLRLPGLNQLNAQDDFTRAVASLTSLKHLGAQSDNSGALRSILSQLHSPLTDIDLWRMEHDHEDPALYLANFAPTLKVLDLYYTTPSHGDVCYSSLTHLMASPGPAAPQLSVLMAAFPNVEHLHLSRDCEDLDSANAVDRDKIIQLRKQNIAFQRHGRSWPSLKHLRGDLLVLYGLAVQQQVEDVDIYLERHADTNPEDYLDWVHALLPPLRPKTLILQLLDHPSVLVQVFREGAENVTRLCLKMVLSGKTDFVVPWYALLEGLRYCQALRYLELSLGVRDKTETFGLYYGERYAMEEYLKASDFEDARHQVKAVIPGIEDVSFRIDVSPAFSR